jgi:hypothetical protein
MSRDLGSAAEEQFRQMCALAESGGLTRAELVELKAHLEKCKVCREALSQYRALGRQGIPPLAESYPELRDPDWDDARSWMKLLVRMRADQMVSSAPAEAIAPLRFFWLRRICAKWFGHKNAKGPPGSRCNARDT